MLRPPPHHLTALPNATRAAVLTTAMVLVPIGLGVDPRPAPGPAPTASSRWAPAATATITPGVQMVTRGSQCSGNFVFTDIRNRVYVGYAAHCAGLGEATDTNGCRARSVPLGTRVRFAELMTPATPGTTHGYGRLAYSSWVPRTPSAPTGAATVTAAPKPSSAHHFRPRPARRMLPGIVMSPDGPPARAAGPGRSCLGGRRFGPGDPGGSGVVGGRTAN